MAVVAIGSVHGAPGVTTLALALAAAWPRAALVIEADPDGGTVAARTAMPVVPGLTELAARARGEVSASDIDACSQPLPAGGRAVVAAPGADATGAALRSATPALLPHLRTLADTDVLADVGRLRPGSPALGLVEGADLLVVVVRPTTAEVAVLAHRLAVLQGAPDLVVVCGPGGEHTASEVADVLGIDVLASLPHDVRGVRSLEWGAPRAHRNLLVRAAVSLAAGLAERVRPDGAPWWSSPTEVPA
jgi:hypothetical protein